MEENKEEGCSASTDTVSVVTASEPGVRKSETLGGSADCEFRGRVDGSLSERAVTEAVGVSSSGDDIMVEVLGCRVYVDGICTADGGDGGGEENPNDGGLVEPRTDTGTGYGSSSREKTVEEGEETGEKMVNADVSELFDDSAKIEQTQVVEKENPMSNHEAGLRIKDSDSSEVTLSDSDRNQSSTAETGSRETEDESAVNTCPTEQVHVANGKRDLVDGMEIDADERNTVADSAENGGNESADTSSLNQETKEVSVDEATDTNGKDSFGHEKDQELNPEMPLELGTAHQVHLETEQDKEIDKPEAEQQDGNAEATGEQADGVVTMDSTNSDQSTYEAVRGEVVEAADYNVLLDPNFDVSNYIDFDGMSCCPGNVQHFKAEEVAEATALDNQFIDKVEEVATMDNQEAHRPKVEVKVSSGLDAVDKMESDKQSTDSEHHSLNGEQHAEVNEQMDQTRVIAGDEGEEAKNGTIEVAGKTESYEVAGLSSYEVPLEDESSFTVSDLVWGKVRSHPWWPGQIFDPSDASEKAMKCHKKDCFLVAYFGDGTFAWNDASVLKPFRTHFSQNQKQSSLEAFKNAVDCALEEVSRRVQLGLACSCIPQDAHDKIRFQIVENSGICEESSMINVMDKASSATSFTPDKLVEYVRALARSPFDGVVQLELVIAKTQLLAFHQLKGYYQFSEQDLQSEDNMLLDDPIQHTCSDNETLETQRGSYNKRKHNLKDGIFCSKKLRSLSDLMGETWDSLDGETGSDRKDGHKKQKVVESFGDDSPHVERKTISFAKVSLTTYQNPRRSFKIGECMRRAASQMAGSPSILKNVDSEDMETKGMITEYSSVEDLLLQLLSAAQFPLQGYNFSDIVVSFFSDFRNSVASDQHMGVTAGGKRKRLSNSVISSPETFEFEEDMNDTYWTDMMIQNGAEEQQSSGGKGGFQILPVELKPTVQKSRRPYKKRRYSENNNHEHMSTKPIGYVDETAPAELILNFQETDVLPSEMKLNKMFRHFGRIREYQTEVDVESSRARVVFKKCSDAQVAYNSAGKFNIFGAIVVRYQLSYSISEPFKMSTPVLSLGEEDANLCLPSES